IHIMLPLSKLSPDKARNNPLKFVDTGVPLFFKELFKAGAQRDKLEIKLAGGAMLIDSGEHFKIGERNYTILRKLLWKNDLLIAAEDIGGSTSRTMSLFIESGRVVVQSQTRKIEL
ncbi:MAG: chemotaxis protein CheD, partial [Candidatus Latescibacterota bacterium]